MHICRIFCAYTLHIWLIQSIFAFFCILFTYNCIFIAYLCIFCAYFMHISCIFDLYSPYIWFVFAYFTYIYIFFAYFFHMTAYFMHIKCISCIFRAYLCGSIPGYFPASLVAGCSCTILASPTSTGSCALFIARKLMRICPGTATQGGRPGRPAAPPHRATA